MIIINIGNHRIYGGPEANIALNGLQNSLKVLEVKPKVILGGYYITEELLRLETEFDSQTALYYLPSNAIKFLKEIGYSNITLILTSDSKSDVGYYCSVAAF
ncbi:MAG: hypothetical protein Q9M91_01565 [Candidatus Dojkabacteria bacterium]|nr:hypothetical protein [Candidatus Dojkabacteria bacterium]